jgi:O-antigen/teichoic acid export membrane protein
VLGLVTHPPSRASIVVDGKLTRRIIEIGFAPYCAGIVALINFQIERWFIVAKLGSSEMGLYYLTIVYSTIFTLVPLSLLNLFYPKTVNAFDNQNKKYFNYLIRKHLTFIIIYLVVAILATLLLFPWTLENYLKTFSGQEKLVYLALPGLIAYVLFDSIALILQSAKKMLSLFLFALSALGINFAALAWVSAYGVLTLEFAAILKSSSFILAAITISADLYIRRKILLKWA